MPSGGLASGLPYDDAAVAPAGATPFTAGACPLDGAVAVLAPATTAAKPSVRSTTCSPSPRCPHQLPDPALVSAARPGSLPG